MKLAIVIIEDTQVAEALNKLTANGFSATKLASTGGFLKTGNTTLIIGTDDQRVGQLLELLTRATVFVLDVERFERI
ncbi:MAG: hypothetical protein GX228_09330 [Firmicutes bacterium]|nr:cyclic-di-AMP receptor [Bacillota bacterium]NLL89099.1 hypothetical protein [Bacillota bacterium]HKM17927.1 cyclic-di-AMP receptor [Limnochordia bacterium]